MGTKILSGKFDSCFQQAKYSVPNKGKFVKKKHKKLVKFANEILIKEGETLSKLPLKIDNDSFKQLFFVKLLTEVLPGSISLKETENLILTS